MKSWLVVASLAFVALAPRTAAAQADNSNAIVEPDRVRVAASADDTARVLSRWLRDEPRRRERSHVFAEGLTAALNLDYHVRLGRTAVKQVSKPSKMFHYMRTQCGRYLDMPPRVFIFHINAPLNLVIQESIRFSLKANA